jgi:hypothetical protein
MLPGRGHKFLSLKNAIPSTNKEAIYKHATPKQDSLINQEPEKNLSDVFAMLVKQSTPPAEALIEKLSGQRAKKDASLCKHV